MLIIKTKGELKNAKNYKIKQFIVTGELAQKLNKAQKISKLSKLALVLLVGTVGAGIATAPVTGGASIPVASFIATTGTAASAGVSSGVIIAALGCGGLLVVYGLYKDYNVRVKFNADGGVELEFNKK